ncbi:hypothetical protein AA103196_0127 [Ameyamaea chiangmaiensis NBRC 103196]|nr:hypothetical protein AA103196_0127 [Ameyamaea chiangmaiensis NBRC 103196]
MRAALGVAAGAPLRGRHVALACGDTVLSEAYNWYVPERLTPAMNHALETTDIPFGRAVHDLAFTRATLSSRVLGAESAPSVLENHGLLRRGVDSAPIAYVIETYRDAAL